MMWTNRQYRPRHAGPAVLRDGQWKGRRCFIAGGGPSLRDFDWPRLDGELTIAINRAYEQIPQPSIIFSMDDSFQKWTKNGEFGKDTARRFEALACAKVFLRTSTAFRYGPDHLVLEEYRERHGLSPSLAAGLGNGDNSGFAALNLALCLGADPIYLLGFDMGGKWWHDGYPIEGIKPDFPKWVGHFNDIAEQAKARARIINTNHDSALRCFEFGHMFERRQLIRPVVIAFATAGNGYEEELARLEASTRAFSLDTDFQVVPDRGSWVANTHWKAEFVRQLQHAITDDSFIGNAMVLHLEPETVRAESGCEPAGGSFCLIEVVLAP